MDITKLRQEYSKLMEYLQTNGYSKEYIHRIKRMLELLFEKEGNYSSYEEFFEKYISSDGLQASNKRQKRQRIALRAIYAFDVYGRFPCGIVHGVPLGRKSKYDLLAPSFKIVIDNYRKYESKGEKRQQTIHAEAVNGAAFLFAMQKYGVTRLQEISQSMIRSFFFDGEKIVRGLSYRRNIVAVLKGNINTDTWPECKRIQESMPPIKKGGKNYPYMTKEESRQLQDGIVNLGEMSSRDKAIMSILFYTGLRGVDISKMKLSDIDWRADKISLVQSKTGVPIVLPLRATVGNAIYDYIKNERANEIDTDILFQNKHSLSKGLEIRSVGQIATRAMMKIGVRKESGQKGVRLFRHHLATQLLENNVQTRIISEILGHLSPLSLNPYIDADIKHLRECGLSIEEFPVRKEVFDIWRP